MKASKQKTSDTFTITCYGQTTTHPESERKKMMDYYMRGWRECEGAEAERYANIYFDLMDGRKNCVDDYYAT